MLKNRLDFDKIFYQKKEKEFPFLYRKEEGRTTVFQPVQPTSSPSVDPGILLPGVTSLRPSLIWGQLKYLRGRVEVPGEKIRPPRLEQTNSVQSNEKPKKRRVLHLGLAIPLQKREKFTEVWSRSQVNSIKGLVH